MRFVVLQTQALTPQRILDVSYAFWQTKALLSAVELDVFTILSGGPLDLESLIERTGIHERGARDFFDALVALDLLRRDSEGRYRNQPDTGFYLDSQKPNYIGGLLKHLNERHYRNWSLLTQALKTGSPQSGALGNGNYPALYDDKSTQEIFLKGMTAGSLLAAQSLAKIFAWSDYKTIIDIGTAQGCVPVEIARVHPHLTGGGFDLPAVETVFTHYVQSHDLSDRLKFYSGDFFSGPLPAADVLVMGRILHNWDLQTRKLLLDKAYQALPRGGALIIYDPMIDDDRCNQPHALLSSLNMLIETAGGSEYTGAECADWMRQAGFGEVEIEPLGDLHTAIVGRKS
jgi:hypothetical protein